MQVCVLGETEIRDAENRLIVLRGAKQRILLVMLGLRAGRTVSSAALVDALWGENPPSDPHHALQAQVSRLRTRLDLEIMLTPSGYRLDEGQVHLDVTRFVELSRRARELSEAVDPEQVELAAQLLGTALGLWRGPALADLRDVPGLLPAAARLEEARHAALGARIDADLRLGASGGLVAELHELVAEHPLREGYWEQLMRVLHREGRLGEALEVHARASKILVEQLGTGPGELLARAHATVLADHSPHGTPAWAPAVPLRHPVAEGTSLTGRRRELRVLEDAWAAAGHGIRLVTISGDPGIGKTRLAMEFSDRLRRRGAEPLWGHCDPAAAAPFQPFMEVLRADVAGLQGADLAQRLGADADELVRLLPELRHRLDHHSDTADADPGTELLRTFVAASNWLSLASATEPLAIFIDDLHWADRQTLLLLRHLLRSPQDSRALVVVTVRDRELALATPGSDLLATFMRQSDRVHHLPLAGLSVDEISKLLTAEMGQPDELDRLTRRVADASGGNPLFVVELARELAGREAPLEAPDETERVPAGLREVIERRLAAFPDSFRDLLSHAAVIGSEFDPLVLRSTYGGVEDEIDEFLASADYARLIEPRADGGLRFAFTHELVRGVVYDAIPPLRRAAIHRAAAIALERVHAGDLASHHVDLAHHFASGATSETSERAVHYLMLAGADAARQQALSVALAHYRRAHGLLGRSGPWQLRCDLLIALGRAESQGGDPSYRSTLLAAARLATEQGDVVRLTEAVVANSRGWWSSTAEIDRERVAFIESALATSTGADTRTQIQLLASWSLENVRDESRRQQVLERSEEAVRLAEELADDYLLARTLADHYAVTYATFRDPRHCVQISHRILDIATRRADPGLRLTGVIGLAQASMTLGDFEVAERALVESLEMGEALDLPPRLWLARGWEAMVAGTRGDLARAEELAGEAWELGLRWEQPDASTWYAGQLFSIRMLQGRLDEIIDAVEEQAVTQADGIPAWRCAHAYALTEVGQHAEASRIFEGIRERGFGRLPVDMLWLHAMVFLSGTASALQHQEAAAELHQLLVPYAGLMAHNGTIDAGPVDLALAQTARVIGRTDEHEKHLMDAHELCERIRAPIWLRRVRACAARS